MPDNYNEDSHSESASGVLKPSFIERNNDPNLVDSEPFKRKHNDQFLYMDDFNVRNLKVSACFNVRALIYNKVITREQADRLNDEQLCNFASSKVTKLVGLGKLEFDTAKNLTDEGLKKARDRSNYARIKQGENFESVLGSGMTLFERSQQGGSEEGPRAENANGVSEKDFECTIQ